MILLGSAQGPIDITTLSLTQRHTEPAWLGRSFSLTLTLASLGLPLGALIGGALAGTAGTTSAAAAGTLMLAAAIIARLVIPLGAGRHPPAAWRHPVHAGKRQTNRTRPNNIEDCQAAPFPGRSARQCR
jgi:hypothetical protein